MYKLSLEPTGIGRTAAIADLGVDSEDDFQPLVTILVSLQGRKTLVIITCSSIE